MSHWVIQSNRVDLKTKKADIALRNAENVHINISGLAYDQAGDQTETELARLTLRAARDALTDLLENPPAP